MVIRFLLRYFYFITILLQPRCSICFKQARRSVAWMKMKTGLRFYLVWYILKNARLFFDTIAASGYWSIHCPRYTKHVKQYWTSLFLWTLSYMFWTDYEENKLYRSHMDGTNIKTIQEGFASAAGITADYEGE